MKSFIVFAAAILTIGSHAQAKTTCTINKGSNMQFDQTLFSGEVASAQMFLVGEKSAEPVQLGQFKSFEQWKAINGKSIVTVGVQRDGVYAMSVAHVDLKQEQNILPMDSMALGTLAEGHFLSLLVPTRGLSVNCTETK
jgi:hypothetical protein